MHNLSGKLSFIIEVWRFIDEVTVSIYCVYLIYSDYIYKGVICMTGTFMIIFGLLPCFSNITFLWTNCNSIEEDWVGQCKY